MKPEVTEEIFNLYINETEKATGEVAKNLLKLKENLQDKSIIELVKRLLHKIKGSSSMVGFNDAADLSHKMEDIFAKIEDNEINIDLKLIKLVFTELGVLNSFIRKLKGENIEVNFQDSIKRLDKVIFQQYDTDNKRKVLSDFSADEQTAIKNALKEYLNIFKIDIDFETGLNNHSVIASIIMNTLKEIGIIVDTIPDEKNILAGKFGEKIKLLYISSSEKEDIANSIQNIKSNIKEIRIEKIEPPDTADELFILLHKKEDAVLQIGNAEIGFIKLEKGVSNYSIKNILIQMKNIVDKIAKENKKAIKFNVNAEDIKIKGEYVENITTMLIHLTRNSADHGIENKYYRDFLNKNIEGNITITAKKENNKILIKIEDDGQGIPVEKIKKKIIEKGLAKQEEIETLSKEQIINFIFKSGFSTAEKVTDISGRGVGMDLVKNIVTELGGNIKVLTEEKKGTTFEITLPLAIVSINGK